jgi:hypothetical protein
MALPIGEAVADVVRQTGVAKGATGVTTALSHCDLGISGAKVLTAGGSSLWSGGGLGLGSLGLGLGLGGWGPILFFAAGAATVYGYSEMRKRRGLKRKPRPGRNAGLRGALNAVFRVSPPPIVHKRKRLFSVLGFSVWR